jgi:shikimate dehydrogenase
VISGSTRLAAVIGSPIGHSLSPALHNAGFDFLGVDAVFVALEVAEGAAGAALAAVRALPILGLSVTMPHKDAVADAVDELDDAAAALRSVNCVVRTHDGRLRGHSTDGAGFLASLTDAGVSVEGRTVGVFGAGGAARAVIDAVARAGAGEVRVWARRGEQARRAAALAGGRGRAADAAVTAGAAIVVNATPLGMGGRAELPLDPTLLRPGQVVVDAVYHPLDTALLIAARRAGAQTIDGLGMLVHQAVEAEVLWLGRRPDPVTMRAAAVAELARRA